MSNHDDEHDHDEMGGNYCPVCGEELANNEIDNIVDAIETYVENNYRDVRRILASKNVITSIAKETDESETYLSEHLEYVDAPVTYCVSEDADITIYRQAGTSTADEDRYWAKTTFSAEELIEQVNNDE